MLKKHQPHANRATFKILEIYAGVFAPPRRVLMLAEAPGGFLFALRSKWPSSELFSMSYDGLGAIKWFNEQDPSIIRNLPHNGDLTRREVEEELARQHEASMDLVTADGGMEAEDLDFAEQGATRLVIAQISATLRCQAPGGDCIVKIFEGSTIPTRQLFELMRSLYHKIALSKPSSSKSCNSERYIVANGLKDANEALLVAKQLRCIVDATSNDVHIADLGVLVSKDVNAAFDAMAVTQNNEINRLVNVVKNSNKPGTDLFSLKKSATTEFARLNKLMVKPTPCSSRYEI